MEGRLTHLGELLERTAAEHPERVALEDEAGRRWTYGDLKRAADRVTSWLIGLGVGRGDRVGLFLPKDLEGVAAIHGILRAGAAYVPVDPTAPVVRCATILSDAQVKALVVAADLIAPLRSAWPESVAVPSAIIVGGDASDPRDLSWDGLQGMPEASIVLSIDRSPDDLAYILYTSGSTGVPKGVMLTHRNALTFLDWCEETFPLGPEDRFSSHAPFHFDLSVFDLYAPCRAGGSLTLIGEGLGKDPQRLGAFLAERKLTVWYSAPSILGLLHDFGGIGRPDFPAPRVVLFAGEVFPIPKLREVRRAWNGATFWNLYGPTETNVCTGHKIPDTIPDDRKDPYPIGEVCPPLLGRVVDEQGVDVPSGEQGELVIAGPGVMVGYWNRPDLTEAAFLAGPGGARWYRTGDLVRDIGGGCYQYHGRRDRMVKKRGYRIELGEIESALYRHGDVERAAVISKLGEDGVRIEAFVAIKPGGKRSLIAMKRHCTQFLPHYMVPDAIAFLDRLPMTSTDKVDYQGLRRLAESSAHAG